MLYPVIYLSVLTACNTAVGASGIAVNITIENASCVVPAIDPNDFPVIGHH